jgi:hypothetical protein
MSYEKKPAQYPTLDKPLSLRGQNRLLTAHNLLWRKPTLADSSLKVSPDVAQQRCGEALNAIQALDEASREKLRSHVDWVEAYGFDEPDLPVDPVEFLSEECDGQIVDPDEDETAVLMAMASVEAVNGSKPQQG